MKPIQYNFFKTSKELKEEVKEDLYHSWSEANKVSIITKFLPKLAIVLVLALLVVSYYYFAWYKALDVKGWDKEKLTFFQNAFIWLKWTVDLRWLLYVLGVVLVILYIPFKYGCEYYFLTSARNEKTIEFKEVFCGFKKFFKVLGMEFQRQWLNLLGLVPLIVIAIFFDVTKPNTFTIILMVVSGILLFFGMIRYFKTEMAFRVHIDNPELSSDEVMEKSKMLMSKRIFAYIGTLFTIFPLELLAIITALLIKPRIISYRESLKSFLYLDLL